MFLPFTPKCRISSILGISPETLYAAMDLLPCKISPFVIPVLEQDYGRSQFTLLVEEWLSSGGCSDGIASTRMLG